VVISSFQVRFSSSGNRGKRPDPVSILQDFVFPGMNAVQKYDFGRIGRNPQPEKELPDRCSGLDLHDTGIAFLLFREILA
jgi:hypothetical protein